MLFQAADQAFYLTWGIQYDFLFCDTVGYALKLPSSSDEDDEDYEDREYHSHEEPLDGWTYDFWK